MNHCIAPGVLPDGTAWACDRAFSAKALCRTHYEQIRRGVPLTPIRKRRVQRRPLRHDPQDMIGNGVPEGHQSCTECFRVLPVSEFFIEPRRGHDKRQSICKTCMLDAKMDRTFGAGASVWFRITFTGQGWRCAACRTGDHKGMGWQLDHDHKTGAWRHVLCAPCNRQFGVIEKWRDDKRLSDWVQREHGIDLHT